jgi:hypothetical protein
MGYSGFSGGYVHPGGQYALPPYGVTYQQFHYSGHPYGPSEGPYELFHPVRPTRPLPPSRRCGE